MTAIENRLEEAFDLTADFAGSLDEATFGRRLQRPSNTIWDQIWCVVGARESYARAIEAGEWVGFACSLSSEDRGSGPRAVEALLSSRRATEDAIRESGDDSSALVLDLLLHEVQHHGQLIRFGYGLGLGFPESWKRRWNL